MVAFLIPVAFIILGMIVRAADRWLISDYMDTLKKHDMVILGAPWTGKSMIVLQIDRPRTMPETEKTTKVKTLSVRKNVSMKKKVGLDIIDCPGEPNKNIKKYKDDPESIRLLIEEETLWEKQICQKKPKALMYVFDDRLLQLPYENTNEQIELFKYFIQMICSDKVRKAYGKKKIHGLLLVFNKMDLWGPSKLGVDILSMLRLIQPYFTEFYHYYGQNKGIRINHLGVSALGNIYIQDVVDQFIQAEG